MKRFAILVVASCLPACSSSSGAGSPSGGTDAGADTEQDSSVANDSGSGGDVTMSQDSASDGSTQDSASSRDSGTPQDSAAGSDASDSGTESDASDACPTDWTLAPTVPASIEVPADGGGVLLHAAGVGTQNYACTITDGGTVWTFIGPMANLNDCNGVLIGHHFASDGGAAFPEWIETSDGTYVVGHKLAAYTPDGGSGSVPWLLLQGVQHGGSGTLSQAQYIQRLYTDGGVAPGPGCDAGDMVQVPYGADYYFYGP